MANSKWEYVRLYEQNDRLPLGNWIVVRIDGRGFHRFSSRHNFTKPNDIRALNLMNKAAEGVLSDVQDVVLAYGYSDEYSFFFHHTTNMYSRRASKLISTVVSTFTAHFILQWPAFFPHSPLVRPPAPATQSTHNDQDISVDTEAQNSEIEAGVIPTGLLPTFDARAVCYPRLREVKDYLCWRQADCHVNNLYNTTFWALVQQGGMGNKDAEKELSGTFSADKHEILFSRFGINYNNELEIFKKGSTVFRDLVGASNSGGGADVVSSRNAHNDSMNGPRNSEPVQISRTQQAKAEKQRRKARISTSHQDLIGPKFWEERPWLLVE